MKIKTLYSVQLNSGQVKLLGYLSTNQNAEFSAYDLHDFVRMWDFTIWSFVSPGSLHSSYNTITV